MIAAKAALDSNELSYLVDATSEGYQPAADEDLAIERVAMVRIGLYAGPLWVSDTTRQEAVRINELAKKQLHLDYLNFILLEITGLDELAVNASTEGLARYHPGTNDCRILAEAEVGGMSHLLTLDKALTTKLQAHTAVTICSASEFWASLDIPPGTQPRITPHSSNPLAAQKWWRW